MNITLVAGARPNFMKIAPIIKAIDQAKADGHSIDYQLVHTGQHYDKNMSANFFVELGIPEPTVNLLAGSGTQAEQTAAVMIGFEKFLQDHPTTAVLVVGDVTSTMACAIVAKKFPVPVIHVEVGISSGDMTMPEEVNRIVTDSITDHFFTTSETANRNLLNSGVGQDRVHFVGNTMIDSLLANLDRLKQPSIWQQAALSSQNYYVTTLHRPSNVDNPIQLRRILDSIINGADDLPVIFPVHPRTSQKIAAVGYSHPQLIQVDPMSYLEFIYLVKNARAVITDSGGITEETTVLNVPCMTLRDTTERPETVSIGTNELVGSDPAKLATYFDKLNLGGWKQASTPPLWDGKTSQRIVATLLELYR